MQIIFILDQVGICRANFEQADNIVEEMLQVINSE